MSEIANSCEKNNCFPFRVSDLFLALILNDQTLEWDMCKYFRPTHNIQFLLKREEEMNG